MSISQGAYSRSPRHRAVLAVEPAGRSARWKKGYAGNHDGSLCGRSLSGMAVDVGGTVARIYRVDLHGRRLKLSCVSLGGGVERRLGGVVGEQVEEVRNLT